MNKKLMKCNHILIGTLIISQLFIIMFQAMVMRDVQLFGLSVFESFNIVVALVSLGITIYTYPNKKAFLKFIPYVVALGAYALAHGYHIYQFNSDVYSLQSPNFLVESYYIFRTFVVPLILIFNIYYSGMEKEQILRVLEVFVAIIAVVMIVTNLFGVALRNYAEVDMYNEFNLFDWFGFSNHSRYSYYQLTTKGWFLSGNQMSAVLFMTFPVILYRAYKLQDWYRYVLVALQLLAMFMLGTKTANIGGLLVAAMFVGLWVVFKILKHKERGIALVLAIIAVFLCLFPFSPSGYMIRYEREMATVQPETNGSTLLLDRVISAEVPENLDEDTENPSSVEDDGFDYKKFAEQSRILKELDSQNLTKEEKVFVKEYMNEFCSFFGISPFILENYGDLDHSAFWVKYMQETPNNDYRVLKTMILEDIYKNNDNPLDKYLGMGYTLNYIYTEIDYSYQTYHYGWIGTILLIGPYFALLLYVVYQGLRNFKKMFTLECAMYAVAPVIGLAVAKMSGHVLERPLPLIVMGTVLAIVLLHTAEVVAEKETSNE